MLHCPLGVYGYVGCYGGTAVKHGAPPVGLQVPPAEQMPGAGGRLWQRAQCVLRECHPHGGWQGLHIRAVSIEGNRIGLSGKVCQHSKVTLHGGRHRAAVCQCPNVKRVAGLAQGAGLRHIRPAHALHRAGGLLRVTHQGAVFTRCKGDGEICTAKHRLHGDVLCNGRGHLPAAVQRPLFQRITGLWLGAGFCHSVPGGAVGHLFGLGRAALQRAVWPGGEGDGMGFQRKVRAHGDVLGDGGGHSGTALQCPIFQFVVGAWLGGGFCHRAKGGAVGHMFGLGRAACQRAVCPGGEGDGILLCLKAWGGGVLAFRLLGHCPFVQFLAGGGLARALQRRQGHGQVGPIHRFGAQGAAVFVQNGQGGAVWHGGAHVLAAARVFHQKSILL